MADEVRKPTRPAEAAWLWADVSDKDYWRVGSPKADDVKVPVFSIGCLRGGGYVDSIPELCESLDRRGIAHATLIGPWSHGFPHSSAKDCVGPRVDFPRLALGWVRQHCSSSKLATPPPPPPLKCLVSLLSSRNARGSRIRRASLKLCQTLIQQRLHISPGRPSISVL